MPPAPGPRLPAAAAPLEALPTAAEPYALMGPPLPIASASVTLREHTTAGPLPARRATNCAARPPHRRWPVLESLRPGDSLLSHAVPASVPGVTEGYLTHSFDLVSGKVATLLAFVAVVAVFARCRRRRQVRATGVNPAPPNPAGAKLLVEPPQSVVPLPPWTSPPKPLPGPHNHPFFAEVASLPAPTLRRHSQPAGMDASNPTTAREIETRTRTFERRVSANDALVLHRQVQDTRIGGNTGWRRSSWVLAGKNS
ncbi:hypothetical protein BDY21DRAFT_403598 [Lineolata rhizophorae]|uniref:Uncharacterized protein n=1 Tax=Lineolata rhizophorae TaxID=578093 RepID=A0A6A6NP09_9PEZI|nr:hypothetical protein BDY21DRAFT_403598 [Lineolata rhizophorae]